MCWFLPYIDMNQPQMSMCPPSQNPLHFHPQPILLGGPSALALSDLFHTSNLDWQSISHMVIYMFQCSSLKSSHPRLLPQSPKDCSLHLCLFCCLTYGVIVTIFEVSPKEGACCLGPFPYWESRCAVSRTSQCCSGVDAGQNPLWRGVFCCFYLSFLVMLVY